MSIKFMYITNNIEIAKIADDCGVDRIFIDLEQLGKEERQGHINSVKSHHTISDIKAIRGVVKKAQVLVRVNPIHEFTDREINRVIEYGADVIMLPYFKTSREVSQFLDIVNGRVKTCLLLETKEAVEVLNDILIIDGIDEVHIGLNDLHISYGKTFMFELLVEGTVESLCSAIKKFGIPFGFGGVAKLDSGIIPGKLILAEHVRLCSSMVILSRSFFDLTDYAGLDYKSIGLDFERELQKIRCYEQWLNLQDQNFFIQNMEELNNIVQLEVHRRIVKQQ